VWARSYRARSCSQLVVFCGEGSGASRFAIHPDSSVVLRVVQDSISGTVALKPDQSGTTSLAVIANGMRQYLTVTVPPRGAPGKVDCP
jgi:hypothetical protein